MSTLNNPVLLKTVVLIPSLLFICSSLMYAAQGKRLCNGSEQMVPSIYDSNVKLFKFYGYGGLENDSYEVATKSLLDRGSKLPLSLQSDTTANWLFKNFEILNNAVPIVSNLKNGDSIRLTYTSVGCFHNIIDMGIIYKHASGFTVKFTTDTGMDYRVQKLVTIKKNLPNTFADTLMQLAKECTKAFGEQEKIFAAHKSVLAKAKNREDSMNAYDRIPRSTTSSSIFLKRGNKVFSLTSEGILDIPYYFRFIRAMKLIH